jgi:hypothetical protein
MKQLHATATCSACGQSIVFQGDLSAIACGECGWASQESWQSLLVDLKIKPRMSTQDANVLRLGPVRASLFLTNADVLNCAHCGAPGATSGEWFSEGATCRSCERPFAFSALEGDLETGQLVLTTVPPSGPRQPLKTFTINCAACGAPLSADGTLKTIHCQFCHASNVVPVAARANRPMESVFIGLFSDSTEYPRDWAFGDNPTDALNAMQASRRRPIRTAEAAHLLVKHKHHLGIFKELTEHHGLWPDLETTKALLDSTEPAIAAWAQHRVAEKLEALRRQDEKAADEKRKARNRILVPVVLAILAVVAIALMAIYSPGSADP